MGRVEKDDVDNIMSKIRNDRANFKSTTKKVNFEIDRLVYKPVRALFNCCRRKKIGSLHDRRASIFDEAQRKFVKSLDAVRLIRAIQEV